MQDAQGNRRGRPRVKSHTQDAPTPSDLLTEPLAGRVASESRQIPDALALMVLALVTYATIERGAFFEPASGLVTATSLVALALGTSTQRAKGRLTRVEASLLLFASFWWGSALLHHDAASFEPLAASAASMAAASFALRIASPRTRRFGLCCVVAISAATGLVGMIACDARLYPFAMRAQNLWRLSGTLTYANAAGLLMGIGVVVALNLDDVPASWQRLTVAASVGGLVATQSRGAAIATMTALLLFARHQAKDQLTPILLGLSAGLFTVAASAADGIALAVAFAGSLVSLAIATSGLSARSGRFSRVRAHTRLSRRWFALAGGLILASALGILVRHEILTRLNEGSSVARLQTWASSWTAWTHSFWLGVGPDQPIVVSNVKGTFAFFAHNEYLQIATGGGVLCLAVLTFVLHSLVRGASQYHWRGRMVPGVLLVLGIAGSVDFVWHLPALMMLVGVVLGASTEPHPKGYLEQV